MPAKVTLELIFNRELLHWRFYKRKEEMVETFNSDGIIE